MSARTGRLAAVWLFAVAVAVAAPALAQVGPLYTAWTTENGVVTRGDGVSFVGGEPAHESSLIVTPPDRTSFTAPGPGLTPQKIATVGRRTASMAANINGLRLTLTEPDGTGVVSVNVSTPASTADAAFVKPSPIRDLLAGTAQEEEDACYTVFGGDILVGESEDDPVLVLVYCARRVYDDPRGTGLRTSQYNWAYDQVAVLSASVDALSPGVMPDWTIQISDRVHQSQRVADNNAIGQTWAGNVTENPARAGEYVIGIANYLNGNVDNQNDTRGLNTVYAARAVIDRGEWSLSPWVEVDAYDAASSGRHTHFALPYWWEDRVGIVYAVGDGSSQNPSAFYVDQALLARITLAPAEETFRAANPAHVPLSGGLAGSTQWRTPDGTLTSTATGFVRIGPRSLTALAPQDAGVAGFGPAMFIQGSFFDHDLMPGVQPVGAVAAGGRVWLGADEGLPAIMTFPQADLLTENPVLEASPGLPDWDIAFSMASARNGDAYAWISKDSGTRPETQRLLWLSGGRWGTLTSPERTIKPIGASSSGVLIEGDGVQLVAPPRTARLSRGLVAGRAVENLAVGVPTLDEQNDPNLSMSILSEAEREALGVPPCPIPGATIVRVTARSGVRRDTGMITYDSVPMLGPSVVTYATYSLSDRQVNQHQSRVFAWDGSTNVPVNTRLGLTGNNWSARGWQIRSRRASADSLATLGGSAVAPRLTFRWTAYQPALFGGDFLAALAITPTAPEQPALLRVAPPGSALPAVVVDARFPESCGEGWSALVGIETGPGFSDVVVPATGRTPLVAFVSDLDGAGPAVELIADMTPGDHAMLVRSFDASGAPTEARITRTAGDARFAWDMYTTARFVMTAGESRGVWMSWDGRPFFEVWSDPAAGWCPAAARIGLRDGSGAGDVRLHHAAFQSGISPTSGGGVLAWTQGVEATMADRACNPADLAEPFGTVTFADITAFLTAFAGGNPDADLSDPVGQFTFADITAFLAAFAAGCP